MTDLERRMYGDLFKEIKDRIRRGQVKAAISVNHEMISMYWDIGKMIQQRQEVEGWSKAVIPNLSKDLKNELPKEKGFSERNLGYMLRFSKEYPDAAFLQQPVANLPWGHHIVLIQKVKDMESRLWYMASTIEHGWSRAVLTHMIESGAYLRREVNILTQALPEDYRGSLPSIEELEQEFGEEED